MPVIAKKRNGFYYFNDLELPSITKVLQDVVAKPALYYWYGREAARIALKNPELNEKEVMAKLQLQVKDAQERGHYVHAIAEEMPNIDIGKIKDEYKGYVMALQAWWSMFQPQIIGREVECYNQTLGYGCRVDHVSQVKGETWLLDFKTGKDIYKEVGLQLCAGKHALLSSTDIKPTKTGVVLLMETGEWQFKETNDTIDDLQHLLGLWRWMQRKGE